MLAALGSTPALPGGLAGEQARLHLAHGLVGAAERQAMASELAARAPPAWTARTSSRIADPEKFEHVTYYVNGRDGTSRPTEEHVCVRAGEPDYRARPQMGLGQVTEAILAAAARGDVALVLANLANIDVVGHTGDLAATVRAAEHTDAAVERVVEAAARAGRWVLLVSDHGNAEQMTKTGPDGTLRPYGGHTTNPVPVVLVPAPGQPVRTQIADGGTLADVAPTVLTLLGREVGAAMTGRPLL